MKHAHGPLLSGGVAFVCAAVLLAAAPAPAPAASAVGHVSVTILPTAGGVGGSAMSFGTVDAASAAGQVALSPAGTASGPAAYSFGGSPAPARVTLTGAPGTAVTVSVSAGDVARGPGAPMPFRVVAAASGAVSALDRAGMLHLALGATLSVGRAQGPGAYHGTYIVTVDY
jgi:spore coat protein U-like protein